METLGVRFQAERVPGRGRGKKLGFPTVNLKVPEGLPLAHGIYACWVRVGDRTYPGALHYGPVPSFGEEEPSLEVHVLDHVLESTPQTVQVDVVRWLRPVLAFDSTEALQAQMERDLEACREALGLAADPVSRVAAELRRKGVSFQLHRFPQSTRTALEAARALGTPPDRIVKSLLFLADGQPVLALVSGAHRVSTGKLARACGADRVRAANPDTVARLTGFPAGAVPPVAHATPVPILMDDALLACELVYAGAGDPNTLVALSPQDLLRVTAAQVVELREVP
ncbi:MAG: YbaK/EbsC family protein [bacterium]